MEIVGHGYVAGACGVIPGNSKYTGEGTGPVNGDDVQFFLGLDEVVGVLFANILDTKVVDNKGEIDGLGGVLPERRSYGNRGESKMVNMRFEPVIGDAASFFEAGHAFADIEVNPAVGTK